MNPFKIFLPSYLFNPSPGFYYLYFWPVLIFFLLVFIGSYFANLQISKIKHPEVLKNIPQRMREFAIIGLILNFLRDQNIPFLAMRFWLVLLFIAALIYGIYLYKEYKKAASTTVIKKIVQQTSDKYLPQPKKKTKKR
ncbi:hypothetical protein KKC94_05210 [Patescibacteria group bacterium]|nr:hypothetical protein [Patescibacteria group bacterium]